MRPYPEEPGAEQFACPVLDWRRRGRPLRRPYGTKRPLGVQVLIPQYTSGKRRKPNPLYEKLMHSAHYQARKGRKEQAQALRKQAQQLPSIDPDDPDYRRLRFCRYADDFILGLIGPKEEAEEIKQRLRTFLQEELKLELSPVIST